MNIFSETTPSEDVYHCRECGQNDHADELNDQFWCPHCSSQDLITMGEYRHEQDRKEQQRLEEDDLFYAQRCQKPADELVPRVNFRVRQAS